METLFKFNFEKMVGSPGLEPGTVALKGRCSTY